MDEIVSGGIFSCLKRLDKKILSCEFSNPFLALEAEVANVVTVSTIQEDNIVDKINPFSLSMTDKGVYAFYYLLRFLVK